MVSKLFLRACFLVLILSHGIIQGCEAAEPQQSAQTSKPQRAVPVSESGNADRYQTQHYRFSMDANWTVVDSVSGQAGLWLNEASFADGTLDLYADTPNGVVFPHEDRFGGMETFSLNIRARKRDPNTGGRLLTKYLQYNLAVGADSVTCILVNERGENVRLGKWSFNDIQDTEWHNYAIMYDGFAVSLLVDDEVIDSAPFSGNVNSDHGHDLYIGKNPWGDSFHGQIDSVNMASKVYTLAELNAFLDEMNLAYLNSQYFTLDGDILISKEEVEQALLASLYPQDTSEPDSLSRGNIAEWNRSVFLAVMSGRTYRIWSEEHAQDLTYSFTANMGTSRFSDSLVRAAFRDATKIWMKVANV